MSVKKISEAILGVGVDDTTIDLFESQYPVPTGVSYNSYVILDEKTAVLDTVDARATEPWLENLSEALAGRKPDYLVVSHMEPDHGANIAKLAALYPEMQVVGNAKTFLYMDQFFGADAVAKERRVVVKDGESLSLGTHTLTFVFAPMVHWPEVMVSYESSEKVLFSADGFGRFGAVAKFDEKADWASEARRYYLNIVGKYGPQVQALLKKAAAVDIQTICPLHGADRRSGQVPELLRHLVQLQARGAGKDPCGKCFHPRPHPCSSPPHGRKAASKGRKGRGDGPDPHGCVLCRHRSLPLRKDRAGLRHLRRLPLPADGKSADPPQDQELPEPHGGSDGEWHMGTHGRKAHARRAGRHEEHHGL